MKNICTAALLLLSGVTLINGQQQDLSKIKVNYSVGKISAEDAMKGFLAENKIKSFAYSNNDLEKHRIQGTKCINESVLGCANKILKGLPLEALIFNNTLIIRQKILKVSEMADTEELIPLAAIPQKRNDSMETSRKETKIEEVVLNAGYYKVKDKERTGSIAKISAKDVENQPVTNVLASAQGRMAGVNITQNGGTAGGGYQIQIRGQNSLRTISNSGIDGNQPLYVVDGVPISGQAPSQFAGPALPGGSINPLNSISPQDIESFEILKDADATAIYGSRGANGVVLITTKKGKSGRLGLSFNSQYSFSKALSNLDMMDTQEYIAMRRKAFSNNGVSVYPATAYDINGTWDQNRYTDWRKELIGNLASASNTQLSLTGGNETTTFLVSFGHQEQGTVHAKDFKYKTNNISTNLNHQSKDSRFRLNISSLFSNQKNNVINEDLTKTAYTLAPNAPALYHPDGGLNWQNNTFTNPVAAYNASYSNNNVQFMNNYNAEYELLKNVSFKFNGGFNYQGFEEWSLRPNTIYNPAFVTGQSSAYSQASKFNQHRFSYILEPQLNWNFQKGSHQFDILVGATYQQDVSRQGSITGIGFESNSFIENIAAAQTKVIGDQISSKYRYAALFGRINYQLNKKYILNVTGRRDGSSRFGPNNKFADFGAVGAAWLFSKENIFKDSRWLSFGKLRGSIGTSGSDNIGDYQYLDTYTILSTSVYNGVTGLIPSRLYNPDFSWEKTTKMEMALEFGLFKSRLNLTAAYYHNRSSNQLVGYQLPAVTGFTMVNANLDATVQNTGLELEANAHPIVTGDFQWQTSFNISFPKNKLLSFPGLSGSTYANTYVIGQPVDIIRLYHLEGIHTQTGQYQFTDYNQDGKVTSTDDRQIIENLSVQYFGGWSNQFRYANWDLSLLFQFVKQKSRNYNASMASPGLMNNLPKELLNVWSPENPSGYYMPYRSSVNTLHSLFQNSDATVSDGSFIRLKNIQLSYRIPLKESSLFRDVKIYFQGQNLWTWTRYFGIDPESGTSSFLPALKTYAFGIQFNL
ncbi:SusC/RagA family TonB-linked outer membrane protein [Pedobacter alluvionis]|uniref:SusC/RagA family TonB-linked outer membrane protein n=1 Tax=Pedobacter alluvionis TaxID=475253 RepID=A0A497Y0X2_9SPHI|nr:SusC/RagA family TonB-linked outer membrane protein [Pedobacter alluvionis]RLJ75124.1 TonB-linked SusC/RagA family outer membrane protein [Pedobacter alluvionis]TFB30228.1 SusC/RagA family TonB-linked outer membrane protein [Pedobacter alluvionis]